MAWAAGLARGVILMEAACGCDVILHTGISELGLRYVIGILPNTSAGMPLAAVDSFDSVRASRVNQLGPLEHIGFQ